jgi:hypothetical protein
LLAIETAETVVTIAFRAYHPAHLVLMYAIRKLRCNVVRGVRIYCALILRWYRSETQDNISLFPLRIMAPSQSDRFETARKSATKLRSYFGFIPTRT